MSSFISCMDEERFEEYIANAKGNVATRSHVWKECNLEKAKAALITNKALSKLYVSLDQLTTPVMNAIVGALEGNHNINHLELFYIHCAEPTTPFTALINSINSGACKVHDLHLKSFPVKGSERFYEHLPQAFFAGVENDTKLKSLRLERFDLQGSQATDCVLCSDLELFSATDCYISEKDATLLTKCKRRVSKVEFSQCKVYDRSEKTDLSVALEKVKDGKRRKRQKRM